MAQSAAVRKKREMLSMARKNVNFSLVFDSKRVFGQFNYTDDQIKKNWHNIDVANIQSFTSRRLFKLFAANDSSFSASLYTHCRMMSDDFRATAYKTNQSLYSEGQAYIDELLERFNYEDDHTGFSQPNTIADQIGQIGRNVLTSDNSSCAMFIQLFKNYEAEKFKIIDCDRVYFNTTDRNKKKATPFIYENNKKVELDYINFLWQPLDPDAEELVGNNPLRPGLRTTFTKIEFLENLRKVLRNQAWPKIKVVLDEEAVINMAPADIQNDSKKIIDFLNDYIGKVEDQLTGIQADQNIILYDTIKEISFLESTQRFDPSPVAKLLDSEQISSFKAPPSTVGKGGSTKTAEGLASAELVIFRRSIKALRRVIETIYSRSFTVSLRLKGLQGFVKFRLKEFTLRPPEETAQFDSLRQDNIIEGWAVGAIGEEEKNRKIRQIHDLEGVPPEDAKIKPEFMGVGDDKQTERTPISNENKEKEREETRKKQKTGSDKKAEKLTFDLDL